MLNVSAVELLVILAVGLVVLGPQKLPGAARQVGRVLTELRRMASGFQAELRDAFDDVNASEASPPRSPPLAHQGPLAPPVDPAVPAQPAGGPAASPAPNVRSPRGRAPLSPPEDTA
jgi:sec-independent protein translocase protein TatB